MLCYKIYIINPGSLQTQIFQHNDTVDKLNYYSTELLTAD